MRLWLKDKDGKPDAVLTFATLSVAVVLIKLLFAGAVFTIGKWLTFTVVGPDAGTIGAVFLPTLGAYVSNRYVNYNYHPDYVKMKKDIDGDGDEEEVLVPKDQGK